MIDTLKEIGKMLIAVLPFVLLCIRARNVNLDKTERSKQVLMPVLAVVYTIAMMLTLDQFNNRLLEFIKNIPDWIRSLASLSWMPQDVVPAIQDVASVVKQVLDNLNLTFWIFYISNTVLMIGYLLLKRIAMPFMRKFVKTSGTLHLRVSGMFYEFFSERGTWCLKESYVQVRGLTKLFYYTGLVISVFLMIWTKTYFEDGLLKSVFYPVFGLIILGELYFYLDGATRREYAMDILGEDENAYKVVNYSLLRKFLRTVFGDKLLAENTGFNSALSYGVTTDELLREMESSEDQKVVTCAYYYRRLYENGKSLDHNYLGSSLDLLQGKSILFNNPFYSDLIPYAFYPMNRALLAHQKVLVVLGRHGMEEDVKQWLSDGINAVTNLPDLWKTEVLSADSVDPDIGIITRSDVLNIELHEANSDFLENVGFVVVLEPSRLVSTAQIGLNLLVKKCNQGENKQITFCLCDKNCDGLVDAMSHALMTNLTEVSPTKKHSGTSSYMLWGTDGDYIHHRLLPNISRYLGMGTELSFAALKNQVSQTKWFGGDAFPVTDIRWIDNQYYYELTKYAGLPSSQRAIDEHFITSPNTWSCGISKTAYLTVEDESFNMFEILRDFSTRSTEQGFINVISSDYMLREYMASNASIFEADPKAIPYIAADYTRSNRNTILRLILMMSIYPVPESRLRKELSLLGMEPFDIQRQLWLELYKCYATAQEISQLPEDYEAALEEVSFKKLQIGSSTFEMDIIRVGRTYTEKLNIVEPTYSIVDPFFHSVCVTELKSAGYVSEDEKGQRYYLGAELGGHIYQKYLPGQFFTLNGKYYEMQYLTADGQVLVRRAADHITGRPAYRQIRNYVICGTVPGSKVGSVRDVNGMKVVREFADLTIYTPGYYRMERYGDFAGAKRVLFEGENSGIPVRNYRNKEILCIELPDMGGKLTDEIRYTITVLFNEVFRTLFAENQPFISAVTDDSFLPEDASIRPLTYGIRAEGAELRKNCIYIIEDSQLDLGLTVAVERNLSRIFGIVQDYIDWHMGMLEESLVPPEDPVSGVIFGGEGDKKSGAGGFFGGLGDKIKGIINRITGKHGDDQGPREEDPKETGTPVEGEKGSDTPIDGDKTDPVKGGWIRGVLDRIRRKPRQDEDSGENDGNGDGVPVDPVDEENDPVNAGGEVVGDGNNNGNDGGDGFVPPVGIVEEDGDGDGSQEDPVDQSNAPGPDDQSGDVDFTGDRSAYHDHYYTLFGGNNELPYMDLRGTGVYLIAMGFLNNPLRQARAGKDVAAQVAATFKPNKRNARYCDFCGNEIFGVEYETLADGRDRCMACSKTAIKTGEEFRKIFEDVRRNMEAFFGIHIDAGIKVEMVNSKTLHKRLGEAFVPTPKSDARVLGVAIKDRSGYTLLVENGSPRMASILTMAHELTHIWQYLNWNDRHIRKTYGRRMRLEIYEGMAKWVEIQYAYLINEPATAKREELITCFRDDEYGRGFLRYRAAYSFSTGTVITKPTPFERPDMPLPLDFCGSITIVPPETDVTPPDEEDPRKPAPKPTHVPKGAGVSQRTPGHARQFAYELLNESHKKVYDLVVDAFRNFAAELTEFPVQLSKDEAVAIVEHVTRDHPELFWYQNGTTYYYDAQTLILSRMEICYAMTREEAQERQRKIDEAVKPFLRSVTEGMSDYDVVLRVYENIIHLVDYDTIAVDRQNQIPVTVDRPDDIRTIYGVFVNRKAVCAGYAKATQYLLNLLGIECSYVSNEKHAWNLLKLEGDYYHLDTTWGDHSNTVKEKSSDRISYDCFCITTEEVLRLDDHEIPERLQLPLCTATKCNYFHRNGLFLETLDFDRIRNIVLDALKAGKMDVSLKFASDHLWQQAKKLLVDEGKIREAIRFANLKLEGHIDTTYSYIQSEEKRILTFIFKNL